MLPCDGESESSHQSSQQERQRHRRMLSLSVSVSSAGTIPFLAVEIGSDPGQHISTILHNPMSARPSDNGL
jgi:hypothetical protein